MSKWIVMWDINPIHYGHIELIKTWLQEVDTLDFLVWDKRIYALSLEMLKKALRLVLDNEWLGDKVSILEGSRLDTLNPKVYDAMILWSDVLKLFDPANPILKPQDRTTFEQFQKLVVLQRIGNNADPETIEEIRKNWKVVMYDEKSSISASEVRKRCREWQDFSDMLPPYVASLIWPELHLIRSSTY